MTGKALEWHSRRTYSHSQFAPEREREATVSVCVPARNEAETIGTIVETLAGLRDNGAIDQVVVVDGSSEDRTAEIAAVAGATVHHEQDLLPEFGPVLGKGDALWRSLSVLGGDIVCFLDADSGGFGPHFALGLVGPLLREPSVQFVKGFFRRPFAGGSDIGGRVTELTARPLLNRFYPDLAGFRQPLAGELAARRALLERLPFSTGYAVEIALLIDAWKAVGLDGLAQVDLELRQNRHQRLPDLVPMAYAVLRAVCDRLEREGRLAPDGHNPLLQPDGDDLSERAIEIVERPPMATVR
jgi:glucosyl-3-phosphoglycerate synthase